MIKLLVVDDSEIELAIIREALSHTDIEYKIVSDSQLALQAAIEFNPTIILLAINMPHLSGLKLCEQLRQNPSTSQSEVVFMTASENKADVLSSVHLRVADYIAKPIGIQQLLTRVSLLATAKNIREECDKFRYKVEHTLLKYSH